VLPTITVPATIPTFFITFLLKNPALSGGTSGVGLRKGTGPPGIGSGKGIDPSGVGLCEGTGAPDIGSGKGIDPSGVGLCEGTGPPDIGSGKGVDPCGEE
jgi:hypothetical protein